MIDRGLGCWPFQHCFLLTVKVLLVPLHVLPISKLSCSSSHSILPHLPNSVTNHVFSHLGRTSLMRMIQMNAGPKVLSSTGIFLGCVLVLLWGSLFLAMFKRTLVGVSVLEFLALLWVLP